MRRVSLAAALLAAAVLAAGLLHARESARLASRLEAGMQLFYESQGERQPHWSIDSVRLGATLREGSECAVVHLRRRPDQSASEESRLCLANDTVTTSDSTGRPKRRLRERYALSLTTATGGTFEMPDSSRGGAWHGQRSFELREIRPKAR